MGQLRKSVEEAVKGGEGSGKKGHTTPKKNRRAQREDFFNRALDIRAENAKRDAEQKGFLDGENNRGIASDVDKKVHGAYMDGWSKGNRARVMKDPAAQYLASIGHDPMEMPTDWESWDDNRLKQYPITQALLEFRRKNRP